MEIKNMILLIILFLIFIQKIKEKIQNSKKV